MMVANLAENLSSAPSMRVFQQRVQAAAKEHFGTPKAVYYQYDSIKEVLVNEGDQHPIDDSSQPGQVVLWLEPSLKELPLPARKFEGSTISLPVRRYGELVGVLTMGAPHPKADSAELQEFITLVAVLQEQVRIREELSSFRDRSRDLLVRSLESLEGRPGHVKRVSQLCSEMATMLDLSAQLRSQLFQAAHYHDVGHLSLIDRSRQEAKKLHPEAGADFLNSTTSLQHLAYLVLSHHERYDGSGRPRRLKGEQLPIECWVLALAEHIEDHWQEHPTMSFGEKLKLFYNSEASKHHPEVIDAFSGLVDSGKFREIMS